MGQYTLTFTPNVLAQLRDRSWIRKLYPKPRRRWIARARYLVWVGMMLGSFLLSGYIASASNGAIPAVVGFGVIWATSLFAYSKFVFPWAQKEIARAWYELEAPREFTLVADDEGIRIEGTGYSLFQSWTHIKRVVELPHGVAILAGLAVYHVPISSFGGENEVSHFVAFTSARLDRG
ncbi:hypothetical protein [Devosia sp.]|uniref:hypothetical protein n=1 Tax=Devosia sp. TaxID=1871048 RepID=UPI003BA9F641